MDFQGVTEIDRSATLFMNGSDSLFMDGVVYLFSSMWVWIPLVVTLLVIIIRNNKSNNLVWVLLALALTVLCCDQVSSHIIKPLVHRFRPTQDPLMLNLIDTVKGYRGGQYGFLSSHAANSFGIVTFVVLLVREKWFSWSVIIWAILNSLTRVYLGVHFVGDILCGAVLGILTGSVFYFLMRLVIRRKGASAQPYSFSSAIYTGAGYRVADLSLFRCVLYGTYMAIILITCILQGIYPY